jgi:hypothetical protein
MPVVLKIDPQRRVVYSAFYGRVTDEEFLGHRTAIATDPDFNPNFSDILDFTAVTEVGVSERAVTAQAENPSIFSSSAMHIIVAPADVMFQLGKMFKQFSHPSRPNVFIVRTRAEAYRLLSQST